jgi:hypothetical protein
MWLLHMENARNIREFRLPELPRYSVDGYYAETKTVREFLRCYFHGHTCLHFRDLKIMGGETLAERYEHTM